jgi:hypothetical protein
MENYDDIFDNIPETEQNTPLTKEEYAAKKKAERDNIFALSDTTALEAASDGEKFRQYLDVQAKFDRYGTVNTLLIAAQKPEATRLGDFEYWKNQGGSVKPGQQAISILEPHEYTKEDGTIGTGYNLKKVFDISQADARKLKTNPPPKFTERQLLAALISKAPMKISGVTDLPDDAGAVTNPETGEISVRKGMAFDKTFTGVANELGCYEACANADKVPVNPSLAGYCTAYMLSKKYGVDTKDFDFTDAPEVFGDLDAQGVKAQLSIIRDAAEAIGGRMAKHLDAVQKAAKSQDVR